MSIKLLLKSKSYFLRTILAGWFLFLTLSLTSACSNISSLQRNPVASDNNVRLGLLYLQNGQKQLAQSKLLLALQQDKYNCMGYDAMGYFLERSGQSKNAKKYYLQGIKIADSTNKGACYNNYGTYLYRQENYNDAINYFLKAVHEPTYLHVAAAYENAGLAALALHDKKKAKKFFQRAISIDPNLVTVRRKLAT